MTAVRNLEKQITRALFSRTVNGERQSILFHTQLECYNKV